MTVRYAVTFEFETQPQVTHRGTVVASQMPTCFARAAREAVKAHPGLKWSSMICVLLERVDTLADRPDLDEAPVNAQPSATVPLAHEAIRL